MRKKCKLMNWSITFLVVGLFSIASLAKNIGFFPGTFDPPHLGHEAILEVVGSNLGLDEIVVFVNVSTAHKPGANSFEFRRSLADIAFSKIPNVRLATEQESEKFGEANVEYFDTLASENPIDNFYSIAGSDVVKSENGIFTNRFKEINLRQIVVARGTDVDTSVEVTDSERVIVVKIGTQWQETSSSSERSKLQTQSPDSTSGQVPSLSLSSDVVQYVNQSGRYGSGRSCVEVLEGSL